MQSFIADISGLSMAFFRAGFNKINDKKIYHNIVVKPSGGRERNDMPRTGRLSK